MGRLSRSSTTKVSSKTLSLSTSLRLGQGPGLCTFVTDSRRPLKVRHGSAVVPTFRGVKPCKHLFWAQNPLKDGRFRNQDASSAQFGRRAASPATRGPPSAARPPSQEQGRPASTHRHLPGVDQDLAGVSHRGQLLPKVGQHDDVVAPIAQHPGGEGLQQGQ